MRALILDFDGLIVDTESAVYQAWRELYEGHGHELPLPVYVQCVGSTFGQYDPMAVLDELCGMTVAWDILLARKDARIRELQAGLDAMPGIRELLAAASRDGIPCAVASSSSRSHVAGWLERCGLTDQFAVVRTRDEVPRVKPEPDLFVAAAEELGLMPRDCLVLEDSRHGLTAAMAAGAPCLIVPSPVTTGSDFTGAADVWHSLQGMSIDDLQRVWSGASAAMERGTESTVAHAND